MKECIGEKGRVTYIFVWKIFFKIIFVYHFFFRENFINVEKKVGSLYIISIINVKLYGTGNISVLIVVKNLIKWT